MLPVLLSLLLLLPQREPGPGEIVEGELGFQLDEYLTRLEGLGFSGVVGVEFEGEPILVRGYGMADREAGRRVTPETVFTVGSITKQFTAAAILGLQDDGKLSAQDPLGRFFDDVPADKRGLTLHHLLTHSSGLADSPAGDHDLRATADWVRAEAFRTPLEWKPGERYGYRNVNYSLLAMVVERVSGEPYEAFLRRRLFEPAGMEHTGYRLPRFALETLAVGYLGGERWGTILERPMLADGPVWTLRGNGGIHSTVGDMLRWHHALQEDRALSATAHRLLETPFVREDGPTFYAYGWSIDRSPGDGKLVAHNGGNRVFFADFLRYVDEGHCVYVATNVGSVVRQSLAYDLAGILYGHAPRALPATIARDRASLEAYAGRYPLGEGSFLEVRNLGDRLGLTGSGPDAGELLLDAREQERLEKARALAAEVFAGRDEPLLALYGGPQPPDSIRAELAAARARWAAALGTFRAPAEASARLDGEDLRAGIAGTFERGQAVLALSFGPAGALLGFECLDAPAFTGLPTIELFPFTREEFRPWNRQGAGAPVRFELDGAGRATAIEVGDPPVSLARE